MNYSLEVTRAFQFDLPRFMFSQFNCVDFGGDLFGQWPAGIRFEIGVKQVHRAVELFNFTFARADDCVLVSQDFGANPTRSHSTLFKTPGIFRTEPAQFQTVDVSPFDETEYRLTWACLSSRDFDPAQMFQGVANNEQVGMPKISSRVYVIDPHEGIIMHMYDDRGLDVIATKLDTLRPMFERFRDWILDNQRHKIEFRFESRSGMLP